MLPSHRKRMSPIRDGLVLSAEYICAPHSWAVSMVATAFHNVLAHICGIVPVRIGAVGHYMMLSLRVDLFVLSVLG